jgi:predicted double-glycine peptidase
MIARIRLVLRIALLSATATAAHAATLEVNIGFDGAGGFIIEQQVESLHEIKRRNIVMQERDFSCGSASLATLFNYYLEAPVDEREIIETLLELNRQKGTLEKVIERKGFSLLDLKHFAEAKKFKSQGYRLDFDDLVRLGVPAIVPIIPHGYKHFVVFRGVKDGRVFLADPAFGHVTQSVEEFKRDWYGFTNVALVVAPADNHMPTGHPLTVSELDQLYLDQDNISALLSVSDPFQLRPGEF